MTNKSTTCVKKKYIFVHDDIYDIYGFSEIRQTYVEEMAIAAYCFTVSLHRATGRHIVCLEVRIPIVCMNPQCTIT